ncbi:MAG: hypothetical protein U9Q20_03110 [Campylobacterota bacterium]|nr:hypothetical protein [Campylobacterota bacterium]
MKILYFLSLFISLSFSSDIFYYNGDEKVYLHESTNELRTINKNIKFYLTSRGSTLGITDKILIKIKTNEDINDIINDYNITLVKKVLENTYLIKVKENSQTLEVANEIYLDKRVNISYPDFLRKRTKR